MTILDVIKKFDRDYSSFIPIYASIKWIDMKDTGPNRKGRGKIDCIFRIDYSANASSETINTVLWQTHSMVKGFAPELNVDIKSYFLDWYGKPNEKEHGIIVSEICQEDETKETFEYLRQKFHRDYKIGWNNSWERDEEIFVLFSPLSSIEGMYPKESPINTKACG